MGCHAWRDGEATDLVGNLRASLIIKAYVRGEGEALITLWGSLFHYVFLIHGWLSTSFLQRGGL